MTCDIDKGYTGIPKVIQCTEQTQIDGVGGEDMLGVDDEDMLGIPSQENFHDYIIELGDCIPPSNICSP